MPSAIGPRARARARARARTGVRRARGRLRPRDPRSRSRTTRSCATPGMLGLCIPERYGGMGASFQDYMHVSAELARFCPMTALTYNMHSQTTLWTGILADDLDMPPDVRERHERIRSELYRWILEDGAIMSQPLSEGIARGATAGVATTATPGARRLQRQRPQGVRVAGRRRARLQLHLPRAGRGGPALPLGALRQPRRAHRRRLGPARHARHRLAHAGLRGRLRRGRRRAAADRAASTSSPRAGRTST